MRRRRPRWALPPSGATLTMAGYGLAARLNTGVMVEANSCALDDPASILSRVSAGAGAIGA